MKSVPDSRQPCDLPRLANGAADPLCRKGDYELPVGWRPGFYTFEELENLGVPPAVLINARKRHREWQEALRPDVENKFAAVPANLRDGGDLYLSSWLALMRRDDEKSRRLLAEQFPHLPVAQAGGVIWPVTSKYRCLVVVGSGPPPPHRKDLGPGGIHEYVLLSAIRPHYVENFDRDFPEQLLPDVRSVAGSEILFARLWRQGHKVPCLTLRRKTDGVRITADGLERVRSRRDAPNLIKHLPFFLSLKKWGRPLTNDDAAKRQIAREANRMHAKEPDLKWAIIADRLGVTGSSVDVKERKLRRWRAAL